MAGKPKLTPEQVAEIRRRWTTEPHRRPGGPRPAPGITAATLAADYRVCGDTIRRVVRGLPRTGGKEAVAAPQRTDEAN